MYFPSLCFCIPEACDCTRAKRQPAALRVQQLRKHCAQASVGARLALEMGRLLSPVELSLHVLLGVSPQSPFVPKIMMGTLLLLSYACALTRTSDLNDRAVPCIGGNDR